MTAPNNMVFLLDVDNTFLDHDGIVADPRDRLVQLFGDESRNCYWPIFEAPRG